MRSYWIKTYHPEVAEGVDPTFYDVNLPWDGGISLPFDIILIDTKGLETMEWIVNMTAHELLHAKPGYMPHSEIYKKAEEVRKDYMDWLEEQKKAQPGHIPHSEISKKTEEVRNYHMDWPEEQNACD